ncbi:hypothetical protein GTA08_BOTSDO05037 [Botryosphaeria dothidea]|uniref:Uncharacterized protein n=1 Tax=Botryosphaeria dothidea TaxID=55169 RepID=A0A8H4N307_9PEZI|nr:hypothetical protein GTA08_BOTSDO05037 [Botryosphaeria dothidea]
MPPSAFVEREPATIPTGPALNAARIAACRKAVLSQPLPIPTIHASLSPLDPARLQQPAVSSPSQTTAAGTACILAPNFYTTPHLPLRLLVQISSAHHWSKSLGRHTSFVQCHAHPPPVRPSRATWPGSSAPHDRAARPACAIFRPVAPVSDVQ